MKNTMKKLLALLLALVLTLASAQALRPSPWRCRVPTARV